MMGGRGRRGVRWSENEIGVNRGATGGVVKGLTGSTRSPITDFGAERARGFNCGGGLFRFNNIRCGIGFA